jgi:hypothetical protein
MHLDYAHASNPDSMDLTIDYEALRFFEGKEKNVTPDPRAKIGAWAGRGASNWGSQERKGRNWLSH